MAKYELRGKDYNYIWTSPRPKLKSITVFESYIVVETDEEQDSSAIEKSNLIQEIKGKRNLQV